MTPSIHAGVLSGVLGLFVFLVIHHIWIKPIWMIFVPGLLIAVAGGAAIGWAYFYIRASLPARPWNSLAMLAIIIGVLAPGMALSFTHGPLFDLATAKIPTGQGWAVAARFGLELALTSTIAGALIGAWLGGTPVAAASMAVAGLAFALGPGHNIPMFGTNPLAFKGHAIVLFIAVPVAFVLVEGTVLLSRR